MTDVPETVIVTAKGILNLAPVEWYPRFAIKEFEFTVDHREDFVLSKMTMWRWSPAWGRSLQANHK